MYTGLHRTLTSTNSPHCIRLRPAQPANVSQNSVFSCPQLLRQPAAFRTCSRGPLLPRERTKMQAAFKTCMPQSGVFSGSRVAVAPQRAQLLAPSMSRRGTVQVVAAEEQNKKRTPQPVKRAQLSLERRSRNRSRKSAIATRTKKVAKVAEAAAKSLALDEQQASQLDTLVSEAFQEIDKAVSKGTLHANTGARRKARVSLLKRQALIAGGLYAPQPEQPGFFFYQRIAARRTTAAAAAERAAN